MLTYLRQCRAASGNVRIIFLKNLHFSTIGYSGSAFDRLCKQTARCHFRGSNGTKSLANKNQFVLYFFSPLAISISIVFFNMRADLTAICSVAVCWFGTIIKCILKWLNCGYWLASIPTQSACLSLKKIFNILPVHKDLSCAYITERLFICRLETSVRYIDDSFNFFEKNNS